MADEAINAKAAFAAGDYKTAAALFTQLLDKLFCEMTFSNTWRAHDAQGLAFLNNDFPGHI